MSDQGKGVEILNQLGLTSRQAESYLTIVELGQPTAKQIATALKIARAEVYRVTSELQRIGLIQKVISTPTTFKPVSLKDAFEILLQLNAKKQNEIQAEAEQFLHGFRSAQAESNQDPRYCLATGSNIVDRQYLKDLQKIEKNKDCILNWKTIRSIVNRDFELLKEALKRGVKIRFITFIPENEEIPKYIKTLAEEGSFEIKSTSTIPKAGIDIFDQKIIHIITLPHSTLKEIEVLRSDNEALVDTLQDYFQLKWQKATHIL